VGAKVLGLGTLFIGGLILGDLLLHPAGVAQLGNTSNQLLSTGGNQLLGSVATTSSKG
jgi:hypothetical protein